MTDQEDKDEKDPKTDDLIAEVAAPLGLRVLQDGRKRVIFSISEEGNLMSLLVTKPTAVRTLEWLNGWAACLKYHVNP